MRIVIDLNVLLDVAQKRTPFYPSSEQVMARARKGECEAVIPGHLLTTFYYLLAKHADTATASTAVDGLLADFEIVGADKRVFAHARALPMKDFEDSVVAATAAAGACDYIVSRNTADFAGSPVPAITPTDFLALLQAKAGGQAASRGSN